VRKSSDLLVLTPSVPAGRRNGKLLLDEKAASGLRLYAELWPGHVRCIFRELAGETLPFASLYEPDELALEIEILPPGSAIPDELLRDAAIVLGSADSHLDLPLAEQCRRLGVPLAFVIENILETRFRIIDVSGASLPRRIRRKVWEVQTERRRKRAFRLADGLQSNGTPAAAEYGALVPSVLTYFDTRMRREIMAAPHEIADRARRLLGNEKLHLAFSGRLERLKGVDDLIDVAGRLVAAGLDFELDIFGTGSREKPLREAVERHGLRECVRINAALPFEEGLVPWMREHADLFLCCHPQSDPSCTYMETLGCGVPIAGFANRAWCGILEQAPVGWAVPIGDTAALARQVLALNERRDSVVAAAQEAIKLATKNSFEATFERRVGHLVDVAKNTRSGRRA